jgi:3-oxoadipate CoA-transferase, alpha subunit
VLDKQWTSCVDAVADIFPGAQILVSGFGESGVPLGLLRELAASGVSGLTLVSNNAGFGDAGIAALIRNGQVAKLICSYPRAAESAWFEKRYFEGSIELELVPQGTLSERIRAGGAGIAAFYTRSGVDTEFAAGKEARDFHGQQWLLEEAIVADFAFVRAHRCDRWGNATYRKAARNFGPTMVAAAKVSIVEADEIVPLGALDPEEIVTPGIYVDRVVVDAV